MSCVLLEHVKHGSMKNMVCYLFTIFTDLSKRKSSGNLSKFYPLQNHRESEFFWHNFFLETQKCKTRTYFSVASSLSKYYSIQWVGLLWREKVNENSYCQSWSGWWYVLIRHSLRLRLTLTRHKDVGDFRAQRGYSGSVFFHLKSQSWTQIVFSSASCKSCMSSKAAGTLCSKCNVESKTAGYKLPAEPPRLGGKISGWCFQRRAVRNCKSYVQRKLVNAS